jgi:hypothetical protein
MVHWLVIPPCQCRIKTYARVVLKLRRESDEDEDEIACVRACVRKREGDGRATKKRG